MGKIDSNASIEIIPLEDSNSPVNQRKLQARSQQGWKKMPKLPYISDPTIVPRVQKVRNLVKNVLVFFLMRNFSTWNQMWTKLTSTLT